MFKALLRSRWAWLVLLLVVVKAAFVLSLADVFFYGEELEKGTAAKAMLDGLAVPHYQLAYHYYEGGGFVISHCVALSFLLVGQNLLAHKLVALAFQIAILIAGCKFTRRLFGTSASVWFGLLFVLGPESYQRLGLISLGIHFEACLFLFGVLGLGARLLFDRGEPRRDWFLLGLVTGAGLFFSYQIALAAVWVAGLLIVQRPREVFGRGGALGILGTAIGAAPLLVMYALVGDAVFDIHGVAVTGATAGPSNLDLVSEFLRSIFVEASLGERVSPVIWIVAFLASSTYLLRRTGRSCTDAGQARGPVLFVLGYMLFFVVVYLASGFVVGRAYHYFVLLRLVPLWVLAAVLIAAALGKCTEPGKGRTSKIALLLGSLLLAVGVRASAAVVFSARWQRPADNWEILTHHKGYDYGHYFLKVLGHFEGSRMDKLRLLEAFDEDARGLLRADAVSNLYGQRFLKESGGDVRVAWARARRDLVQVADGDAERLAQYELGLGALQVVGKGWNRKRAFESAMLVPESRRQPVLESLGRFGGRSYPTPESIDREVQHTTGQTGFDGYLRGLGRWAYRMHRLNPEGFESVLAAYPAQIASPLRAGFEAERRWHMRGAVDGRD